MRQIYKIAWDDEHVNLFSNIFDVSFRVEEMWHKSCTSSKNRKINLNFKKVHRLLLKTFVKSYVLRCYQHSIRNVCAIVIFMIGSILCASTAKAYLYLLQGAESERKIPEKLLCAIACVESGRISANDSKLRVWPWTINVQGRGYVFKTKSEAISAIKTFQAKGYESIDVGIMQINLKHHPHAFRNLEEALDPAQNIAYAARLLHNLFVKYGSWHHAVRYYHSANPQFNHKYLQKVLRAWAKAKQFQSPSYPSDEGMTPLLWTVTPKNFTAKKKIALPGKFESSVTTLSDKSIPITVSFFPLKLGHGVPHQAQEKNDPAHASPHNASQQTTSLHDEDHVFALEKPFKAVSVVQKKSKVKTSQNPMQDTPKITVKKTLHPLPLTVMPVDVMPIF